MLSNGNGAAAPKLATTNQYSDSFSAFNDKRLFDRLQKKFTPKPFFQEYKILQTVSAVASYLCNALSAATAATLVFFFLAGVIGSAIVAGILTAVGLVVLELSKRETSTRFFNSLLQYGKFKPGLAAVILALSAASIASSYFGAQVAVVEFTPPAALVNPDSLTAPLQGQLKTIDRQIADARKTQWKGTTTRQSQRTIERLTRQRETLTAELVRIRQRTDNRNDQSETRHQVQTTTTASRFAVFTLACELVFLLCVWFLEYYDYRSFAEYGQHAQNETTGTQPAHAAAGVSLNGSGRPIVAHARADDFRTVSVNVTNDRECKHCGKRYTYRHAKQKFCSDACRMDHWQEKNGKTLKRGRGSVKAEA